MSRLSPAQDSIERQIADPRNPGQPPVMAVAAMPETLPLLILHRPPTSTLSLLALLRTKYTILDSHDDPPNPSFPALSKSARLIFCLGLRPLTSGDLDRYPAVECVVCISAGVNHIDLAACRLRGIRVTSAGDSFSDDTADYAVGLAIDVLRRISAADRFIRAGSWPVHEGCTLGSKVSGKRVGIVGLGSIGSRVAKRFEAFGCPIAYNSRKMKSNVSFTYYANVVDLASNSDILIVCCALTNETHHIIDKGVMTTLGKTGIIINIGRGPLIDEKELVKLLVRGEIGGAGFDVFENEPEVPDELLTLDNVVLSPHRAVVTLESMTAIKELVLSNIDAFFSNKSLQAEVEFD